MEDPLKLQSSDAPAGSVKGYEQEEADEDGSLSMLERSGIMVSVEESGLLEDNKALKGRILSASSQGEVNRAGTTTPQVSHVT